jgi:hypothetical protein
MDGSRFLDEAREQADSYGVERHQGESVTSVAATDDGFIVSTTDDEDGTYDAEYVVLATGSIRGLADSIGCEFDDDGTVSVNLSMETSVDDCYATGAMVRDQEWQAVISAGDGGAALDILSKEEGDVPGVRDHRVRPSATHRRRGVRHELVGAVRPGRFERHERRRLPFLTPSERCDGPAPSIAPVIPIATTHLSKTYSAVIISYLYLV